MAVYKEAENVPRAAYRVTEVASAVGVTSHSIYQQVASGNIPSVRIGGRLFVPARFFEEIGLEEPVRVRYPEGARLGVPDGYTVAEGAAALGMTIPNVYELTARGVIPMYKEDGRRLIPSGFFAQVSLDAPLIDLAS